MLSQLTRAGRLLPAAIAAAVLLAACSSGGVDSTADSTPSVAAGYIGIQDPAAAPTNGGTLTFGSYAFPAVLDPAKSPATGPTGGTEMAAIYDTLVRHDSVAKAFVPQLAESVDVSDDLMTYTLTLPAGTTFSDGSALDANAVKWSIDRFNTAKGDVSQIWANIVATMTTPDARTVEIQLKRPWSDFPALLSMGPGMIVAASSVTEGGFTPIGAGPFTVTKFAPREELLLTSRADYIGGKPHLDALRFLPTSGSQAQYESLRSGQFDMTYLLSDPAVISQAQADGYAGFLNPAGQNAIATINSRQGRPGSDVRVRQAIAYGVDPEAINQRVNSGLGVANSALITDASRWYNGAEGVAFDPARAQTLLNEAKADGYDGRISYLSTNEPRQQATALAVQAALNSVGFDVTINYASDNTEVVRKVYAEHDFDLVRSAAQPGEEAPFINLYNSMGSDSRVNAAGFADPKMDQLLLAVQTATSDDAKIEAISQVQLYANETVPFSIWGPQAVLTAWAPEVHDVKRNITDIMLFDKAWMSTAN